MICFVIETTMQNPKIVINKMLLVKVCIYFVFTVLCLCVAGISSRHWPLAHLTLNIEIAHFCAATRCPFSFLQKTTKLIFY